ncbi:MAG: patatin-like phospholipase family protein, partial [Myxococcales bacterium]|nr:patatin-like phospholipase family protein [Myxococcales bacterium]
RFNTPIAPCIRAGADRLVVVSLLQPGVNSHPVAAEMAYPNPLFLLGKVLNALLLDPVTYDLQVLQRFNRLVRVLDDALTPVERAKVDAEMTQSRGLPYRELPTLVFRPSVDLGELAGQHLAEHRPPEMGWLGRRLLERASRPSATWEDDLASYVLFDGAFARALIDLGRADMFARADEVRAFYAG